MRAHLKNIDQADLIIARDVEQIVDGFVHIVLFSLLCLLVVVEGLS